MKIQKNEINIKICYKKTIKAMRGKCTLSKIYSGEQRISDLKYKLEKFFHKTKDKDKSLERAQEQNITLRHLKILEDIVQTKKKG